MTIHRSGSRKQQGKSSTTMARLTLGGNQCKLPGSPLKRRDKNGGPATGRVQVESTNGRQNLAHDAP
jgi:hypothetical protein